MGVLQNVGPGMVSLENRAQAGRTEHGKVQSCGLVSGVAKAVAML